MFTILFINFGDSEVTVAPDLLVSAISFSSEILRLRLCRVFLTPGNDYEHHDPYSFLFGVVLNLGILLIPWQKDPVYYTFLQQSVVAD